MLVPMPAQGQLVNDMRYLASVVTQCFTAFGELLALNKRFAELSGGVTRCAAHTECSLSHDIRALLFSVPPKICLASQEAPPASKKDTVLVARCCSKCPDRCRVLWQD